MLEGVGEGGCEFGGGADEVQGELGCLGGGCGLGGLCGVLVCHGGRVERGGGRAKVGLARVRAFRSVTA